MRMGDRAVSTALSYALILGIVTLLLSGLTMGFAPLVTNQQADATHSTLTVLGNDVAGDIETADQLVAAADGNGTVVVRTRLPDRVGGSHYEIDVQEADEATDRQRYEITLTSLDHETSATVRVQTRTEINVGAIGTLDGGPLQIALQDDKLVVSDGA